MLKKTSAHRIPNNEIVLLSCLFQYRKRRECGKTPVKCTLEITFPVFSYLVSFIPHLEICCLLFFTHLPVFLFYFIWGKYLLNSSVHPIAAGCQGLQSWTSKFGVGMANFCLSALRVRGLLRLKWLGWNHKNRASAFLHAPACPTVGGGREDKARWGSVVTSWK